MRTGILTADLVQSHRRQPVDGWDFQKAGLRAFKNYSPHRNKVDSAVRASPTELALPRFVSQTYRVCLDVHDFPGSNRL